MKMIDGLQYTTATLAVDKESCHESNHKEKPEYLFLMHT